MKSGGEGRRRDFWKENRKASCSVREKKRMRNYKGKPFNLRRIEFQPRRVESPLLTPGKWVPPTILLVARIRPDGIESHCS